MPCADDCDHSGKVGCHHSQGWRGVGGRHGEACSLLRLRACRAACGARSRVPAVQSALSPDLLFPSILVSPPLNCNSQVACSPGAPAWYLLPVHPLSLPFFCNIATNQTQVRLLIIDEVHLLNDERGPVIETLVARTTRQASTWLALAGSRWVPPCLKGSLLCCGLRTLHHAKRRVVVQSCTIPLPLWIAPDHPTPPHSPRCPPKRRWRAARA